MKTKIHLVMPMAGRGSRFSKHGFDFPKPLIEIYGKPFFYWAVQSVVRFVDVGSIDFVVLQEHIDNFGIDRKIKEFYPDARIHPLPGVTEGAVVTSLKGIPDIGDDLPVVFNDCDHLFKSSVFNSFCNSAFDPSVKGILLTFSSDEPKYSFIGKDEKGNINRTVEKQAISNEAICGCYYFSDATTFRSAAEEYLGKCSYSEFFMSGVYNIMIEKQMNLKSMLTDYHVPFGIPEEYETAKKDGNHKELER